MSENAIPPVPKVTNQHKYTDINIWVFFHDKQNKQILTCEKLETGNIKHSFSFFWIETFKHYENG